MRNLARFALLAGLIVITPGILRADATLNRMRQQLQEVKDYRCDMVLNATLPQISVSNMRMELFYKSPNKVRVKAQEGFAALPQEGLFLGNPMDEIFERFTVEPMGESVWQGRRCIKYSLQPKKDVNPPFGSFRLYVDKERAVPVGFLGQTSQGGQMQTVFTYQRFQGKYWLPTRSVMTIAPPAGVSQGQGRRAQQMSGRAEITFSNYKINTGLSDSIFVRPDAPGARKTR